jgi:hypothetical protein
MAEYDSGSISKAALYSEILRVLSPLAYAIKPKLVRAKGYGPLNPSKPILLLAKV